MEKALWPARGREPGHRERWVAANLLKPEPYQQRFSPHSFLCRKFSVLSVNSCSKSPAQNSFAFFSDLSRLKIPCFILQSVVKIRPLFSLRASRLCEKFLASLVPGFLRDSPLRSLSPAVQNPQLRIPLRFLRSVAANSLLPLTFLCRGVSVAAVHCSNHP